MWLRLWPAVCDALAVLIQAAGAQAGPPVTDPPALPPATGGHDGLGIGRVADRVLQD